MRALVAPDHRAHPLLAGWGHPSGHCAIVVLGLWWQRRQAYARSARPGRSGSGDWQARLQLVARVHDRRGGAAAPRWDGEPGGAAPRPAHEASHARAATRTPAVTGGPCWIRDDRRLATLHSWWGQRTGRPAPRHPTLPRGPPPVRPRSGGLSPGSSAGWAPPPPRPSPIRRQPPVPTSRPWDRWGSE